MPIPTYGDGNSLPVYGGDDSSTPIHDNGPSELPTPTETPAEMQEYLGGEPLQIYDQDGNLVPTYELVDSVPIYDGDGCPIVLPRGARIIDLSDTPQIYGSDGQVLAMNSALTGVEWVSVGAATVGKFIQLIDTPTDYVGRAGKMLAVNLTENGVEFIDLPTEAYWGNITGDITQQTDLIALIGSSSDKTFKYVQESVSDTWDIAHGLDKYPSVLVIDSAGTEIEGQVIHINNNNITIKFTAGFRGEAYLN